MRLHSRSEPKPCAGWWLAIDSLRRLPQAAGSAAVDWQFEIGEPLTASKILDHPDHRISSLYQDIFLNCSLLHQVCHHYSDQPLGGRSLAVIIQMRSQPCHSIDKLGNTGRARRDFLRMSGLQSNSGLDSRSLASRSAPSEVTVGG